MAYNDVLFGDIPRAAGRFNSNFQSEGLTLDKILSDYFAPEFERLQGQRGELEQMFLDRVSSGPDYAGLRSELTDMATSISDELFMPGGQVEQAIGGALNNSVLSGFGTSSGSVARERQNIFGQARDTISRSISQGALQLAGLADQQRAGDIASLLGFNQLQSGTLEGLRESMFGGQASIEQLGLAKKTFGLNQRLIEEQIAAARKQREGGGFFGDLLKTAAGFALGGVGGAVAGFAGDKVSGLLGGERQPDGGFFF